MPVPASARPSRRSAYFSPTRERARRRVGEINRQLIFGPSPRSGLGPVESTVGDADQRHGDPTAEANIDVASRPPDAATGSRPSRRTYRLRHDSERQGRRVERAEDDFGIGLLGREVGEIDVPECARLPRVAPSGGAGGSSAHRTGPVPVDDPTPRHIMRQGDSGDAVDGGFANGRHGPGVMNVRAQVAAGVDPGQDPARPRSQVMKREPHTIGRCSGHRHTAFARPGHHDRRVCRHPVPTPGDRARSAQRSGSDPSPCRGLPQGRQARGRPSRRRWSRSRSACRRSRRLGQSSTW